MKRWEIILLTDEDPEVVENIIRDTTAFLAETIDADGRVRYDISAFEPERGACISEYVSHEEEGGG